ncbi:unnamed protein product [Oncorhynchus mykiss]|uniref:ATP synthase peripheral stalk subunit F6, mitochondrial n=1 Tax=Oncorhynchus mykiss TaxID=8022 RepID=A0A060VQ02_ONCMY|nr:unnamed protein product [Oncorhynchus mykiss]
MHHHFLMGSSVMACTDLLGSVSFRTLFCHIFPALTNSELPSSLFLSLSFLFSLDHCDVIYLPINVFAQLLISSSSIPFTKHSQLDPIQKLFLHSIREYSSKSAASGGLVDAGPAYEKNLAEELTKLQRLYGGGDLTAFPEFKFPEPKLEEVAPK